LSLGPTAMTTSNSLLVFGSVSDMYIYTFKHLLLTCFLRNKKYEI
jgi:hypothetical protein